jgi:hypothetical protein
MIPISGKHKKWVPARQFMFTHLIRWMRDFHIDGIRMDSVENVANWAVLQLWRLDLISGLLRCWDVPCPIDFRTVQVAPV